MWLSPSKRIIRVRKFHDSGLMMFANGFHPGAWLLHCHIAFHASSGMALQILENTHRINYDITGDRQYIEENCKKWTEWRNDPMNLWDKDNPDRFQDDSGV